MGYEAELAAAREHVAFLYRRLDAERALAAGELVRVLRDNSATTPEERWQRQVSVDRLTARVQRFQAAESGLCFGRIDSSKGQRTYIGRIGLLDEENDYVSLLVDWRAPAARPFYCATAATPEGLVRRRHFHTRERSVLGIADDVFDLANAEGTPGSDGALLAALDAPREATMRDIVATIQAEQDEIIRLDHRGVLVIQGGPGTGKTAVALHRIAYLLYTQRRRLSRWGVLVIGPNPAFLHYIGNVLPSLGETDVVFAAMGELLPGLRTSTEDSAAAKRVKGSLVMVEMLAAAVADRQELPEVPIEIELEDVVVELDREVAAQARERARATGLRHNDARPIFRDQLIAGLTERAVDKIGEGWLEPADHALRAEFAADVCRELSRSSQLRTAIDLLWPELTPQRLLADLFGSPARIAAAAGGLDEVDHAALYREKGDDWTVSDVPLLDEAAGLLGTDGGAEQRAESERREQAEYAEGVLQILDTDEELDNEETLRAVDVIDPERLAERNLERDHRCLAQRAAADREWTYGHVVVDEAQELSEMDWRMIMRRCPNRSMTIVGDLAQRNSPAGARSWADMLDRYVPGRWACHQLTVNYRTPAEVMAIAAKVLAAVGAEFQPPESVRSTGIQPWAQRVDPGELATTLNRIVRSESGEGTLAVIAPEDTELAANADIRTPRQVKGLEFDRVIVLEPHQILADPEHGAVDLYVALTRATQRLGVLHTEPLPDILAGLSPRQG
ncbi:DNA helicase [Longimycelium tulufanense]|uniref:DNA helicase n=1 Tax=Longimycelium tulufanense TaxID=907463 RepID=A0A8J3FW76_9PSEU|nr:DNA helicase [Longimycelium tulufanense]